MKLVIAEKPSVARSIAAVIGATDRQEGYLQGNGYLVSWCVGHLVSFADAGMYDERFKKWRYEDLPIIPESWRLTVPRTSGSGSTPCGRCFAPRKSARLSTPATPGGRAN